MKLKKMEIPHAELMKFLLLAGVLVAYFFYLSFKYDFATGGIVSLLTWSFFVLCTPIADAGFLIDFPVRLLTGLRMIYTELIVWILAFAINISALLFSPASYEVSLLSRLFYQILTNPIPYWSIIALCALGTFLSVYFGDGFLDAVNKKRKGEALPKNFVWHALAVAVLFAVIIFAYYQLLSHLGLSIPTE